MDHEYKRDERLVGERFTLTPGSSARLVDESEIDPAELRRKMSECGGSSARYMDMFCERYRDRGISGRIHADVAQQEKEEALGRAGTPGSYISADRLAREERLKVYRSGVSEGRRYMTADDFARYYHDQRGYRFPQYRKATDAERIRAVEAVKAVSTIRETRVEQPKKAVRLINTDKFPKFLRGLPGRSALARLNERLGEIFPRVIETSEKTSATSALRTRRIPVGLTAALVTVMISMSMVITGTVLVSQATRELSQQKEELAQLKEAHGELSDELALKNDSLHIEERAREELGMVPEKYLHGEYITEERKDELEILDEDRGGEERSGLAWLLSAFGIGD